MLVKSKPNQLTFVDGRFYTDTDGQYYPSATTLLEAYPKPYQLIQWMKDMGAKADEIRDNAGRRGSAVHQLTEDYDQGVECKCTTAPASGRAISTARCMKTSLEGLSPET